MLSRPDLLAPSALVEEGALPACTGLGNSDNQLIDDFVNSFGGFRRLNIGVRFVYCFDRRMP